MCWQVSGLSQPLHKECNLTVLRYHMVWPAKYCRVVSVQEADRMLWEVCLDIALRNETVPSEIGAGRDQVHFLVPSVPNHSPAKIVRIIKRLTAGEIFQRLAWVKKKRRGGEFWTDGDSIGTVGQPGSEEQIRPPITKPGREKDYLKLEGLSG